MPLSVLTRLSYLSTGPQPAHETNTAQTLILGKSRSGRLSPKRFPSLAGPLTQHVANWQLALLVPGLHDFSKPNSQDTSTTLLACSAAQPRQLTIHSATRMFYKRRPAQPTTFAFISHQLTALPGRSSIAQSAARRARQSYHAARSYPLSKNDSLQHNFVLSF